MVAMGFFILIKMNVPLPSPLPPKKKKKNIKKKTPKKPEYTQVYITMNYNLCISLLTWLWTFKCRSKMKRKNIVLFTNCVCVRGTHIGYTCTSAYPVVYLKLHVPYAMLCMHLYLCWLVENL